LQLLAPIKSQDQKAMIDIQSMFQRQRMHLSEVHTREGSQARRVAADHHKRESGSSATDSPRNKTKLIDTIRISMKDVR
jgi:hypothetical protein